MQEQGSNEKASTPMWAPTPFSQGHPVDSRMGSVSISDITENEHENGHEHESFAQYHDPRPRAQRKSEGSAEEDRSDRVYLNC
jgi:hypothetical protein